MGVFVEITVYRLAAGSGSVFHEIMLRESLPLHRSAGIRVIDSRPSVTDTDCYCLVRAFDSLTEVRESQEVFYASAAWRDGPRERIVACIEATSKVVLEMSESQVAAWAAANGGV
jgi:hypothetical protein